MRSEIAEKSRGLAMAAEALVPAADDRLGAGADPLGWLLQRTQQRPDRDLGCQIAILVEARVMRPTQAAGVNLAIADRN